MKVIRVLKWILFVLAGLLLGGGLVLHLAGSPRPDAASVGVIGGADGPTAIFVAGRLYVPPWLVLGLLCAAVGLALYFVGKRKSR